LVLPAARQLFDASFFVFLGAALLLSTAAFVVMRLYMRAVFRESQRSAFPLQPGPDPEDGVARTPLSATDFLEIQTERPDRAASANGSLSPSFQHAETAFRRAAGVYALGGCVHAATCVGLLFLFGIYSLPTTYSRMTVTACYIGVFWAWSLNTLFALVLFWGPDRRFRLLLILGYAGLLPATGVLLQLAGAPELPFADVGPMLRKDEADLVLSVASNVTGHPVTAEAVTFSPLTQPILFWGMSSAPLVMPLVLFFNRFIRGTVGPLFINIALMMTVSTFMIGDLILLTSPGMWLAVHIKEVFGAATLAALMVLGVTLSAVVAWFGLLWIARRYRLKQLSDQTFLFDALWLAASSWLSVYLMGAGSQFRFTYLLGFLPFALYRVTVGYGLKGVAARAARLPKLRMLYLRVFGLSGRSEKLLDFLAARWRYAGSIQLISATDVARGRFEPDEFLDFLNGRLASAYIRDRSDLDRRLTTLDLGPDPDGRFRINEFFCRSDTWKQTVTRLMGQSDLVLMDLRAFASERKGCTFELGALIDEVPLHRVALLIDHTTDESVLRRTLDDRWRMMSPQSPNAHGGTARVRMIDLACGPAAAVQRLMQLGGEVSARG
jgi:hypothetical protein